MFNFLKKNSTKEVNLVAPVSGKTIDLSKVPDPVFSERLAGDGIAIEPTGDIIVAPCDGELTLVFKTLHAFGLTLENGVELLVHIGIDTVSLNGEGFQQLAEAGTKVKAGTPIIKLNRDVILGKGYSLITPVLITNMDLIKDLNTNLDKDVTAGKDEIISFSL
ncbi:PTS sugar transporter subunit IIA [Candidatus Clostridium radicumherbarum]|uniref:PTS glucose transporter subunit IIA n=1 Tax=Candidatus Clostridium radicumherbarum TaxID=3381662 RepID=A0ABW8TPQ8_9CLOT